MTHNPLVLAIETSSRIGSVAIAVGKNILAETIFSAPIRHSAEIFTAIGDILDRFSRKPCNIEQIHISAGPGSFTGLRISVTLAKTMHLANAAKIIAVDTLDVIAANANDYIKEKNTTTASHSESSCSHLAHGQVEDQPGKDSPEKIATIVDAKRGHFFIAAYQRNTSSTQGTDNNGTWKKIFPDSLMTAPQFLKQFAHDEHPIWLLGDGLLYYKDIFKADTVRFMDEKYWSPRASNVLLLGSEKALANKFEDPLTLTPNYLLRPDIKIKTR
ncbi:MAG: tRNA (adenosine(37)-N6)-threonylcarbamoyltransferase complex dimerization subunit type 1 TsaB [Planctomycetes bacterium]|nr:tRNA (adenosine(37)-N6)-threonylcarbamoyltransferase complex dimerization subunit type 1 TsaB [Planctomycetota bacterium]